MERNRGKHPNDDRLFNEKWQLVLKEAATDLSYLMSRGFGESSACKLVGNRYKLNSRQQMALLRISEATEKIDVQKAKVLSSIKLKDQKVEIDGFNLLILLESALSSAYIFKCRDGNYRDISGVHGSYKRVNKTEEAIVLVGKTLQKLQVKEVLWVFDAPVSNSGRLKTLILELATSYNFPWNVDLVNNPDKELAESTEIVISSDRWILDQCKQWFNLSAYLFDHVIDNINVIEV